MRHILIALALGLLTIVVSITLLKDDNNTSYKADSEVDMSINLQETFQASNYILKPESFECAEYGEKELMTEGCILMVELKNTTDFDMILDLDGDRAILADGSVYESSHELSLLHISENGLVDEISVDETIRGGIFFEMPKGEIVDLVEVFEYPTGDPIKIIISGSE